jgi:16S rRNA C1402 (ribose-2'-O) methylase RsmI
MKSLGSGDRDDPRCPQCREFLKNAELIVRQMEDAEAKMKSLTEDLSKYEWVVIVNSDNIKNMRKNGQVIDDESFDVAFRQTKRFLRLLESVNSSLNLMRRRYDDMDNQDNQTMGNVRDD